MNKWYVEYDGTDITEYISSVKVSSSVGSFCYECSISFGADCSLFDSHDWTNITASADLEVFLLVDSSYISLGKFFVEKSGYTFTKNESRLSSIWGRSTHAVLANPFAYKITGTFDSNTTVNEIIEFLFDNYGQDLLSFSSAHNKIENYAILAEEYTFEDKYPIDVLLTLIDLIGGVSVPYKDGTFRFVRPNKSASVTEAPSFYITNALINSVSLNTNIPDFGNRVKVLGSFSYSDISFSFISEPLCWAEEEIGELEIDGSGEILTNIVTKKIIGQVYDSENNPINGISVRWYFKDSETTINEYAEIVNGEYSVSGFVRNMTEVVNTDNFRDITLTYVPTTIKSITYYYGASTRNYKTGATIDGNVVSLATNAPYCDARMKIVYDADGIVQKEITPKGQVGSTIIVASITAPGSEEAKTSEQYLHFGNPCACPVTLEWLPRGSFLTRGTATEIEEWQETATQTNVETVTKEASIIFTPMNSKYIGYLEGDEFEAYMDWPVVCKDSDGSLSFPNTMTTSGSQFLEGNFLGKDCSRYNYRLICPGKVTSINSAFFTTRNMITTVYADTKLNRVHVEGKEASVSIVATRGNDSYLRAEYLVIYIQKETGLAGMPCPISMTYSYEVEEQSFEDVEETRQRVLNVAAQPTPLYCAVKMKGEPILGAKVDFSIIEGGEYGQFSTPFFGAVYVQTDDTGRITDAHSVSVGGASTATAYTRRIEVKEATTVERINQTQLGCFLKNVADSVSGVYRIIDGAINYNKNFLSRLDDSKEVVLLRSGIAVDEEVCVIYRTICATVTFVPQNVSGISSGSTTIRAKIRSRMEAPIEADFTVTVTNTLRANEDLQLRNTATTTDTDGGSDEYPDREAGDEVTY